MLVPLRAFQAMLRARNLVANSGPACMSSCSSERRKLVTLAVADCPIFPSCRRIIALKSNAVVLADVTCSKMSLNSLNIKLLSTRLQILLCPSRTLSESERIPCRKLASPSATDLSLFA